MLTKYELSAEEVGSLKYTVQSPLEVGWDVKEQRPEENDVTPVLSVFIFNATLSCWFILTFWRTLPAYRLQKLPKPWRDSSHRVTGVSSLRQQEGQVEVEALLQLDVPSFAQNQVIRRGRRSRHHSIDQILQRGWHVDRTAETFQEKVVLVCGLTFVIVRQGFREGTSNLSAVTLRGLLETFLQTTLTADLLREVEKSKNKVMYTH